MYLEYHDKTRPPRNYKNYGVTYRDIANWANQRRKWEELVKNKTEVNQSIILKTDLQDNIEIKFITHLIYPHIIEQKVMDFGLIQVNEVKKKYLTITNPHSEPLMV